MKIHNMVTMGAGVVLIFLAGAAQAVAQRDEAVSLAVEASRPAAIGLLERIVNIDSGTGDIAGGEHVEEILSVPLRAAGAIVRTAPAEVNRVAPNLVAVFHGSGKARVLIIAHVDTVFGPGTAAKRPFRIEGNRAYGAGVGDEKGGVVDAVTALQILHQLGFRDYDTITLMLDGSEEWGSVGSTKVIKTLAQQSDVEFNMEPGDPPDALTVWRKGAGHIVVRVRGRAAHAGLAPQNGRNAAVELVHQLGALQAKFTQSGDGTTVNLTVIRAGDRSNIIPDLAEGTFDVRFRKPGDFAAILERMKSSLVPTSIPDTAVMIEPGPSTYPPLIDNTQVEALGHRAQGIYAELGKTIALSGNGGGSESAVVMSVGTPALDGLGFVGAGFHTDHEWIDLGSVTSRIYLFTRLLMEMGRSPPQTTR